MPISPYLAALRARVGHDLLLVASVTAVVRDDDGRVLVQRRRDNGLWCLPGGAMDPGEEPAQACAREAFEETGLVVRPRVVLSVGNDRLPAYPNGDLVEAVTTVFGCDVVAGTLEAVDGESLELVWVSLDELPASPYLDAVRPGTLDWVRSGRPPAETFAWDDAWSPAP